MNVELETLSRIVDELGALKAQIAAMTERESALKAYISGSGRAEIDGALYRATVSLSERATLDADKVRSILSPSQIEECTKTTEVTSVRVVARKRAKVSR